MSLRESLLGRPWAYRLWQAPFVEPKLGPLRRRGIPRRGARLLDLGCGPGDQAVALGSQGSYTGIDSNPAYIACAKQRAKGHFVVHDARTIALEGRFDCVLINSVLHHLDDEGAREVLLRAKQHLEPGGDLHVLELLQPERGALPRLLARMDRGDYPRTETHWRALVGEQFEIHEVEPYPLRLAGVTLWNMLYLGAKPR